MQMDVLTQLKVYDCTVPSKLLCKLIINRLRVSPLSYNHTQPEGNTSLYFQTRVMKRFCVFVRCRYGLVVAVVCMCETGSKLPVQVCLNPIGPTFTGLSPVSAVKYLLS